MTQVKRDWRETLRKMQMPLEIFFGFSPVPLLMGALITPDAWAVPLVTPCVYLLFAWLLLFIPGKFRVPMGVIGCIAIFAAAVLTMPVFTSAASMLLPILFAALLFYSWQFGKWGPDDELSLAVPAVSVVAHVITQFLVTADSRLGMEALYLHVRTPLIVGFLAFMLLALLSMNRDSMQRAVNGGSRAPKKLRRRNVVLALIAMVIAVTVSALPAVIEAATKLWDTVWRVINDVVLWFLEMMNGQRNTSGTPEGGAPEPGGLPVNLETNPLAAFLEKVAIIVAGIGLTILVLFALKVLYKDLKKLFRFIASKLRQYMQASSEDYEDEITDLRDEAGTRGVMLENLRRRLKESRTDEKSLSPRDRIRYLYKRVNKKHAEWHSSATARENIPESAASLYERARYSEHSVTDEDAEQFRTKTKNV